VPDLRRQNEVALVRDTAVQKLRDLTVAVVLASAAAVALIAWVSAATIPGTPDASAQTGTTNGDAQPVSGNDDGFSQGPSVGGTSGYGPGIAVTGGSR
jgi:hypothetical protein